MKKGSNSTLVESMKLNIQDDERIDPELAHMENSQQRQLKELTILHAVSNCSAHATNVDELIEQVTKIIGDSVFVDDFGVALFDKSRGVLRVHPTYHSDSVKPDSILSLSEGIVGRVASTGEPYYAPDVSKDPIYRNLITRTRSEFCIPIKSGREILGVINAESVRKNYFTEDDQRLLITISSTLATSIEKLRLFNQLQKRFQESETLRQASAVVAATLDQDQAVELILEQIGKVVPYDSASILLMKDEYLEIVGGKGWKNPGEVIGLKFPIPGDNPNTKVVQLRSPVVLGDAQKAFDSFREKPHSHIKSWLGAPMIVHDKLIGVLTLDSKLPDYFTHESVDLVTAFTSQAAVAIENARSYEAAIRAGERRGILHRASKEIAQASQDPEKVYQAVHRAAEQLMPAEAFVITLVDNANQDSVGVYLVDKGGRWQSDRTPVGIGLSGLVVSTGKPVIADDLMKTPIPGSVHFGEEDEVRSVLAVPMLLGTDVMGMLSVQSYRPNAYSEDDQELLEMLAANTAVAIENARLYAETFRRLKEMEAINHLSSILRSTQDEKDILANLLREVLQILGTDSGAIWLFDQRNGQLIVKEAKGWCSSLMDSTCLPGDGIVWNAYTSQKTIISADLSTDQKLGMSLDGQIRSDWAGAVIPIRVVEETIGVLLACVRPPKKIQDDAIHLLITLNELAGSAIQRNDLKLKTEHQLQRLASLRAVDMAINTILDLRVTLGILIDHIISQLGVDAVSILLINPKTQSLYQAASSGFLTEAYKDVRLSLSNSLASQAVRSRSTVNIPDLRVRETKQFQYLAIEGFVSYFGVPLIAKGQVKGVLEVFNRSLLQADEDWKNFLETLGGQAAIAIDNSVLFEELQQTNMNLSLAYDATIEGWSRALDLRDEGTKGHTVRVTEMTVKLAELMGINASELVNIRRGALLHDIGKMGIPDSILLKTDVLNSDEWETMRQHPVLAYDMLSPIAYLRSALDIPYCHHERWDGSGYPRHLIGEQIPLAARIFAVVDVWDAIISNRPYRKAYSRKVAVEFLRKNRGKLFDPRVVEAFLKMIVAEKGN